MINNNNNIVDNNNNNNKKINDNYGYDDDKTKK